MVDSDVVFVTLWLAMAAVAGMVADKKHRNFLGWTIATFVFGLFSLIPLLILKPLDNPVDFKICVQCGEKILVSAKICKHCSSSQTNSDSVREPSRN